MSSSIVYTALAAGVLGLMAGLKSASDETKQRVLENASADQHEMAEECIACAEFMQTHQNAIPRELLNHPSLQACEKIKTLPPKKLEQLLRKFLSSDRINRDKLSKLTRMCTDDNQNQKQLCLAVQQLHGGEYNCSGCGYPVPDCMGTQNCPPTQYNSGTHSTTSSISSTSSVSSTSTPQPTSTPPETVTSNEEWVSVDFSWASDDEVSSSMSGYSVSTATPRQ